MAFLRPPDTGDVQYESYSPFAHVPGKYEWCRIHSPSHGSFDCFIVLVHDPVLVYVGDDVGEAFMRDRYPECLTHRATTLALREEDRTVVGEMQAGSGPLRSAAMTLRAVQQVPDQVPYGGDGKPVWGSRRWTCWGVDLNLAARASGHVEWRDRTVHIKDQEAIVTVGSFGRIAALPTEG